MRAFVAFMLLFAEASLAAEMKVERDVAYAEPKNERQSLDVYAPADGTEHPVVVWIHGGGWKQGDKKLVQVKPQAFVDRGFLFVAINYRFVPQVTLKEMTGDVAKAIRWVHEHAKTRGGNPNSIFVMGHSAGAHLAALVCTDERYLKAEGLSLAMVKGCVPVDAGAYDVPRRFAQSDAKRNSDGKAIFGEEEASHRELSPITYVGKVKTIPPFLILHVAGRAASKDQSEVFAKALKEAGIAATVFAAEGKTHGTINSELGLPDDKATKAVFEFVDRQLK
jgi:arylformamidase